MPITRFAGEKLRSKVENGPSDITNPMEPLRERILNAAALLTSLGERNPVGAVWAGINAGKAGAVTLDDARRNGWMQ
jgi:hypothetical protein